MPIEKPTDTEILDSILKQATKAGYNINRDTAHQCFFIIFEDIKEQQRRLNAISVIGDLKKIGDHLDAALCQAEYYLEPDTVKNES